MSARRHIDRDRMEELCSMAVLGEISVEERLILDRHLETCGECSEFLRDLEQIANFDLTSVAALRMVNQDHEDMESAEEDHLFARLVERAKRQDFENRDSVPFAPIAVPACPVPFWKRMQRAWRSAWPIAGWAVAATVVVAAGLYLHKPSSPIPASTTREPADDYAREVLRAELDGWKSRAQSAEAQKEALKRDLQQVQGQSEAAAQSLAHATDEYQKLLATEKSLEAQVAQQEGKLRTESASLLSTQTELEEERSTASALQGQLQDVNARLDKQRTEVAHLREVAATAPPRIPVPQDMEGTDARAIFGARDLHIVDVYDVDHSGNASRTYGRVYYVNHNLLLFYAFDLGNNAMKGRKAVAFQAWGFRQPNSTTAESLGLFYLDDAKLDRWALRVSDPRLLARIDTLFVTIEPPGGSNSPRGHQLLLASLAGPPNHP